jgi:hypothetical protein
MCNRRRSSDDVRAGGSRSFGARPDEFDQSYELRVPERADEPKRTVQIPLVSDVVESSVRKLHLRPGHPHRVGGSPLPRCWRFLACVPKVRSPGGICPRPHHYATAQKPVGRRRSRIDFHRPIVGKLCSMSEEQPGAFARQALKLRDVIFGQTEGNVPQPPRRVGLLSSERQDTRDHKSERRKRHIHILVMQALAGPATEGTRRVFVPAGIRCRWRRSKNVAANRKTGIRAHSRRA